MEEQPLKEWREAPVFGMQTGTVRYTVRPSAYALVADAGGQLAAVRTLQGVFLAGGGIETGESLAQAVVREVLEECGLVVRVGDWATWAVQFVYSETERTHFEKRCTFVEAVLEAAAGSGKESDHELLWIAPGAAPALMSHQSHAWAIANWMSRRRVR
jgi:8-oxo-dGTP diphosphatase